MQWALAENVAGGASNAESYVAIANVSGTRARVRVTAIAEDGTRAERSLDVAPYSRASVAAPDQLPEMTGKRFGVIVDSVDGAPIVVERAMYSDAGGIRWAAGSASRATRLK